jgi:Htaa
MSSGSRVRAGGGISLVAAVVATIALAAPANAAKLGGKTIVAPDPATLDALGAAGVSVAPSGPAKVNGKGIGFPITGGKVKADDLTGKIRHKGGLTFSSSSTALTVKNFVIKLGAKNVIRARVAGGGKVRLAVLDLSKAKIKQRGGKVVVSRVGVDLANKAAKALSATFHLPDLAGAHLGDATGKIKP